MNKNKNKLISKHLSYILRHRPDSIGIELDTAGWVDIDLLISKSPKISNREDVAFVVANNDKQRFVISEDGQKIRANQGHSVSIDLGLKSSLPPDILYHGTATRFLEAIMEQGLKKMNRQHVHLSPDLTTASKVGGRHGKLAILTVDVAAMVALDLPFYVSKNGVWLTDHVPPQFLNLHPEN